MVSLDREENKYFKTNIPLQITPQVEKKTTIQSVYDQLIQGEQVRDYDHISGNYRGAAYKVCNLNCKQKHLSFVPKTFLIFLECDCHLIFVINQL